MSFSHGGSFSYYMYILMEFYEFNHDFCFSWTETAINIGYSCKLLTDEMEEIYVVDGETYEEVETQLSKAYEEMTTILEQNFNSSNPNVRITPSPKTPTQQSEPFGGFALVINGHSLVSRPNSCSSSRR